MIKTFTPIKNILLFFGFLLVEIILIALILLFFFNLSINDLIDNHIPSQAQSVYFICLYIMVLVNLYVFSKPSYIRLNKADFKFKYLSTGFTTGLLSIFLYYFVMAQLGYYFITALSIDYLMLIKVLFLSFFVAFIEEMVFRDFMYNQLNQKYSVYKSAIISSYIYAQLHFLRFDLKLIEVIIPIISLFFVGILLSEKYYSKNIFFSIGLHWSWVLFISYINQKSILVPAHNMFLSGGLYPPTGLIACFLLLVAGIFSLLKVKK